MFPAPSWRSVPVPINETICGLPGTLSLILSVAVRVPLAPGVKVTPIVQLVFAARVAPQVLALTVKSAALLPVRVTLLIVIEAFPELVNVTAWAVLVVLTSWAIKPRLGRFSVARGPVPVPDRVTDCGLFKALCAMISVLNRVPTADGVKVTLMVQLAVAARLAGQLLVEPKSTMLAREIPLIANGRLPEFVSVTV